MTKTENFIYILFLLSYFLLPWCFDTAQHKCKRNKKSRPAKGPCRTCHRFFHQFLPSLVFICPAFAYPHANSSQIKKATSSQGQRPWWKPGSLQAGQISAEINYLLCSNNVKKFNCLIYSVFFVTAQQTIFFLREVFNSPEFIKQSVRLKIIRHNKNVCWAVAFF